MHPPLTANQTNTYCCQVEQKNTTRSKICKRERERAMSTMNKLRIEFVAESR